MEQVISEILKALGWTGAVLVAIASYLVKKELAFVSERKEFNTERKEFNTERKEYNDKLVGLIEKSGENHMVVKAELIEMKLLLHQIEERLETLSSILSKQT